MNLNDEQIISFNWFTSSFVDSNKYISKAVNRDKLIAFTVNQQLVFNFNEFDENYREK